MADTCMLLISQMRLKSSDRARPRVWYYLSTNLRQPDLSYICFGQSPKTFHLVSGTKVQCEPPFKLRFRNPLTYLIT